jgi:hypothetical protein
MTDKKPDWKPTDITHVKVYLDDIVRWESTSTNEQRAKSIDVEVNGKSIFDLAEEHLDKKYNKWSSQVYEYGESQVRKELNKTIKEKNKQIARLQAELKSEKLHSNIVADGCVTSLQEQRQAILAKIEEVHNFIDVKNSLEGEEDSLCCMCTANKYNAKVGIVHDKDCIMIILRKLINELKKSLEADEHD